MVTGRPGTGMVLLHEWHVLLWVHPDLDDATARTDRQEVERTLHLWASNINGADGHRVIEVEA